VGEALNNAIEHGSNDNPGRIIGIEAFAGQGVISATVTDPGHWSKDTTASGCGASRGRGLKLIHGLSDHVETVRTATGTRVTMTYRPDPQRRAGRRARA
jgi:anti-sigma regulatory factor (Ser/Thr protein kinase)